MRILCGNGTDQSICSWGFGLNDIPLIVSAEIMPGGLRSVTGIFAAMCQWITLFAITQSFRYTSRVNQPIRHTETIMLLKSCRTPYTIKIRFDRVDEKQMRTTRYIGCSENNM